MIVAYCFFPGDEDLALKNVQWWNELGGCKGHEVLCCYDPRCAFETVEAIGQELLKGFDKVWRLPAETAIDGWPEGANYLWRLCVTWLQSKQKYPYFFWTEPDAIPMREGWLDALEAAYKRGKKPFMGDRVEVKVDGKEVPLHMSGVGIYQNPIYMLAGEAYRADEIAWDMAAKDQIVPNAFFTDLIEHAWKHPTFHDLVELGTQIAPQTLLFHSSKDGSLIDLLRQKRGGNNSASASNSVLPTQKEPDTQPGSPSPLPVYDILIRTYPGDYEWLRYCLQSISNFVTGFRKIWIISPGDIPAWLEQMFRDVLDFEWKVMNDETEDGYLAQQITKLYADVLTDYQPDYILHVDSDIVFTRPTTPQDFFKDGKMIWYYTAYSEIQTPWQPIIEKFTGHKVPFEYMRRLPMMVPRWLYPKLREFCHQKHSQIISEYIKSQPMREFSEFNALGAYAHIKHMDQFAWLNTLEVEMPEPFAKQFHSWSGLTPAIKLEIEKILEGRGDAACSEKENKPSAVSTAPPTVPSAGGAIKVLPNDLWVLENDQISDWIIQEGRLDHDQNLLPEILKHIRPGASVVDIGAFIGDHTVAYAKAVGPAGMVYAFEPNPAAFKCLKHNTRGMRNVTVSPDGMSDVTETVPLSGNNGNAGGSYVGTHMKVADINLVTLDEEIPWGADFIKIDTEGYELKVLQGAQNIIKKYRPTMVIEINESALQRQGTMREQIFGWLEKHKYDWQIIQENACRTDPLYDILAVPVGVAALVSDSTAQTNSKTDGAQPEGFVVVPVRQPPQGSLSKETLKSYVQELAEFAGQSVKHRMMVRQRLALTGLAHKTPKHRKKGKKK